MHLRAFYAVSAAIWCLTCMASRPALAKDHQLLIIQIPDHGNKAFNLSVEQLIEKPLSKQIVVLPRAKYKKALHKTHLKSKMLHNHQKAAKLGAAIGATHVLVLEMTHHKRQSIVNATLLHAHTSQIMYADRYILHHKKFNADMATQLREAILDKLLPPSQDTQTAPAQVQETPKADTAGASPPEPTDNQEQTATANPKPNLKTEATVTDGSSPNTTPTSPNPNLTVSPWRSKARLGAAIIFIQRNAYLNPQVLPTNATRGPCYCGTNNNADPFFTGVQLQGEWFPFSQPYLSGLGVETELSLAVVKTNVEDSSNNETQITSSLFGLRLNSMYRYFFSEAPTAPMIYGNLGFGYLSFPLSQGFFPGVGYSSPILGVGGLVPVGTPDLALNAALEFLPGVSVGNDAGTYLGQKTGSHAWQFGGGTKLALRGISIDVQVKYLTYSSGYTGTTTLPPSRASQEYSNVQLPDRYLTLMIAGNLVF